MISNANCLKKLSQFADFLMILEIIFKHDFLNISSSRAACLQKIMPFARKTM